jgi:hypothetical protein
LFSLSLRFLYRFATRAQHKKYGSRASTPALTASLRRRKIKTMNRKLTADWRSARGGRGAIFEPALGGAGLSCPLSRRSLIGAGLALLLPARPGSGAQFSVEEPQVASSGFLFRGISYPSFKNGNYADPESKLALNDLSRTGANFVAIIPTQFTRTQRDKAIFRTEATESDEHVLEAIADSRANGLAVMLKPHVDSRDGKPREYYAPADVAGWFESYRAFLVHYARMAADRRVELFCIGCELDNLAGPQHRASWLSVIAAVRQAYDGPIVYAATWNGAKDVSFWDAVDYIGIDAYNPLSTAYDPSVDELAAGWRSVPENAWVAAKSDEQPPLVFYRELADRYEKPVVFTEIGYKSVAGAAARPGDWKWTGAVDAALQARAYEAFFEVWNHEASWMKGAFLWHWTTRRLTEHSDASLRDYTPQNKPAEAVIARWYGGD